MLNPIVILIIGVALLIAMMLVLRLNAFVALITTAMVISMLRRVTLPTRLPVWARHSAGSPEASEL